jgi:hypothetical protein
MNQIRIRILLFSSLIFKRPTKNKFFSAYYFLKVRLHRFFKDKMKCRWSGSDDLDPLDLYAFESPGSGSISQRYGSGSFSRQAKIVRKTLIPVDLCLWWTFKNDVNVPSKSNKQKKCVFVGLLKINDENSRTRIRIWSINQCFPYYFCLMIEGSGSIPLTNGSGSGRLKSIRIRRIRIGNTDWKGLLLLNKQNVLNCLQTVKNKTLNGFFRILLWYICSKKDW